MRAIQRFVFVLAVFAMAVTFGPATRAADPAPSATALTPAQQQQVQELIHTYLMDNPEAIIESVRQYQAKQQAKAEEEAHATLVANLGKLEHDKQAPVLNDKNGDVTIVEFFDYNCGYCKKMLPSVQELLKSDHKVRFVFKEYPILRQDSALAAKAALAVWKIAPEKYFDYHVALMDSHGEFNEEHVLKAAETLGIDKDKLKAAMADASIKDDLHSNLELGNLLGISGTPAFIIGDQLYPGAIDITVMRDKIAKLRAG
jgi:protein-disulfide isomerase